MRRSRWLWLFVVASAVVTLAAMGDVAGEGARGGSVSIGHSNDGKLWNGKQLPREGPGFYSNPARPNATATWGTDEMIDALVKAGAAVERAAPGATLYINDIGFHEGGRIPHHRSHRAGRDADLLFYQFDRRGEVAAPVCIPFDGDGQGVWDKGTPQPADDEQRIFDTRRNWLVVRALLENPDAHVQRIYVAEVIRRRLIEYARDHREPAWVIERANDVMCQPGAPHDDHFHVRLFCTAEDYRRGCRDAWPLYPWRRTQLAAEGLPDPVLRAAVKRRRPRRARGRGGESGRPAERPRPVDPDRLWCP